MGAARYRSRASSTGGLGGLFRAGPLLNIVLCRSALAAFAVSYVASVDRHTSADSVLPTQPIKSVYYSHLVQVLDTLIALLQRIQLHASQQLVSSGIQLASTRALLQHCAVQQHECGINGRTRKLRSAHRHQS